MKQFFRHIIVMCVLFLKIFPVNANDPDEKKINVYPNPIESSATLTIEMPADDYSEVTLFFYNTVGKIIHTIKTTNKKVEFNVPDISGIYLLRIVEKQKVIAVEKIIVKE